MHENECSSRAAHAFSKQNRLKQCFKSTFGRINELLIVSIFQDHILLILMKKMGPRKQDQIIKVGIIEN